MDRRRLALLLIALAAASAGAAAALYQIGQVSMQWRVESPATMSPATVSLNMGVIYIGSAAAGGFQGVATLTVVHQTDIGVSLSGYGGLSSLAVTVQLVSGAGPHATVYSATVSSSSNTAVISGVAPGTYEVDVNYTAQAGDAPASGTASLALYVP
ncbi:MAG: hypothetical protein RXS42_07730 [Nitrososphaeria archaeon]